jgi:MMP 1-O-methyltransferase
MIDEVERALEGVEGWFGPAEGRLLYRHAAAADPAGRIVEIGSWQGRSTIWLAAGAKAGRGARVVAIDPHRGTSLRQEGETTEEALRANLARAGVNDQVDVVVATSEEAAQGWSEPVSFLWIDGDHSYRGARRDLELWESHLLPGATVAFHDTFVFPDVERVVRELLVRSGRYDAFEYADTTTAARRCGPLDGRGRLARRASIARRDLYGLRLRAYDENRLGYARIHDALTRATRLR